MTNNELEHLNLLLSVEEKIRGHAGYQYIKQRIYAELRGLDTIPEPGELKPATRIYPADSGVVERGPDERRR